MTLPTQQLTDEQIRALAEVMNAAKNLLRTLPALDPDSAAAAWVYTLSNRLRTFDDEMEPAITTAILEYVRRFESGGA